MCLVRRDLDGFRTALVLLSLPRYKLGPEFGGQQCFGLGKHGDLERGLMRNKTALRCQKPAFIRLEQPKFHAKRSEL